MNLLKWLYERFWITEADEQKQYDDIENDADAEAKQLAKIYERGEKKLKRSGEDYRKYDVSWMPIAKEYERQKAYKIRFEFIPENQNFRNVRSALQYKYQSKEPWKLIRDYVEEKSEYEYACEICGMTSHEHKESKSNTECHEVWHYNEITKVQKLVRLSPRCVSCHEITHLNRFERDKEAQNLLLERYAELNEIDIDQAVKDYKFAVSERERRKEFKYLLDMKLIGKFKFDYEFDDLFDPHEQSFITFLETRFKESKDFDKE